MIAEIWVLLKCLAMVMGFIRMVLKPIMVILQAAVEQTETETDDLILEKFLGSTFYSILNFVLDYVGSIKIGVTQRALMRKKSK